MDLISQKALLNHLNDVWLTNTPNGSYDMQAAKAEGIAIAMKAVEDFRTVPAVPLDKLCEMLSKSNVNVPCNDDCEGCEAFDGTGDTVNCWKITLTKWMEGLDAKTDT